MGWEAMSVTQVKYEGGLNQGRDSGMERNVLDKFCILNTRLMGLADRANVTCQRNRGIKGNASIFGWSNNRLVQPFPEQRKSEGQSTFGRMFPLGWLAAIGLVPSLSQLRIPAFGKLQSCSAPEAPASDPCLLQHHFMCCPFSGMSSCLLDSAGRKIRFYPISSS